MYKINFLVNEVAGGWEPTDTRLGGTEESVVRWAEELALRGHQVSVYKNGREYGLSETVLSNGGFVNYYPRELYLTHPSRDICINIKSSDVDQKEPTLYLTNEVDATRHDLSKFAGVIWPSQWADENIPVNNPQRFILPHGYDPEKIFYRRKVPKQCLYASSPDRGLETLEQIWPAIVEQHPDAHLYVTYGGKIDAPNVTCGEFSEDEMNQLFIDSEFWLHPANGGELYCISGIKAQVTRAIPVYFPVMALQETVRAGVPCKDAREMYERLISLMDDEDEKAEYRRKFRFLKYPTWADSTTRLLEIVEKVVGEGYGRDEHRPSSGEELRQRHAA